MIPARRRFFILLAIPPLEPDFLFDTAAEIYVCGSPKATYRFVQEFSW